jgi:4-hydroxy-3-methylbut-2-en-1-yl diphosphate synthase IspG/GcpE
MRIGTNHGSLSDRIMNRYGDTPLGMVESALEFARIARDLDYHAFVFSMKSSNPKVMINAYRLLWRGGEEGNDWNYPIHLGVTEAGEGRRADQERSASVAFARWNWGHHPFRSRKIACTKSRSRGHC